MLDLHFLKNKDINHKKKKEFRKNIILSLSLSPLFYLFIHLFLYVESLEGLYHDFGDTVYINRRCITGIHNVYEYV